MAERTFPGGVHLPEHKERTEGQAIRTLPVPPRLVVPMAQSLGAPALPIVEKGQPVTRGEPIGKPDGFISAAVHAPTSGTVTAIGPVIDSNSGRTTPGVFIEADGEDRWYHSVRAEPVSWQDLDDEAIRKAVADAGVVGMGGAAFPTHVKLSPRRPIETVLINGAECEPYLTCDHRVMLERHERIVIGLRLCMTATGAGRGIVCIEANKPDAIETMRAAVADATDLAVRVFRTKYPQGAEKQLILACFDDEERPKEVPTGGLPLDVGVMAFNVQTAVAVADACLHGTPLMERALTVTGDEAVRAPGNFRVRIGTPLPALLEAAQVEDEFEALLFGGPMMGKAQFTTDLPVVKGTSGVLVFRRATIYEHGPCIRCGACVRHCPVYLNPSRLSILGDSFLEGNNEALETAKVFGLMDCILCGACAYVCPSERRIVHLIATMQEQRRRTEQRKREKERAKAAALKRDSESVGD